MQTPAMPPTDPVTNFASKVAVNLITEVFKKCLSGLNAAAEWIGAKRQEHAGQDRVEEAAKHYADAFIRRYKWREAAVRGLSVASVQKVGLRTVE